MFHSLIGSKKTIPSIKQKGNLTFCTDSYTKTEVETLMKNF
jgi:hypothetical protein